MENNLTLRRSRKEPPNLLQNSFFDSVRYRRAGHLIRAVPRA